MNGMRFAEKLAGAPWLCDPETVRGMHDVFVRYLDRGATGALLDVEAVERATGRRLENTGTVTERDGVARISVEGPIFRRANLFTQVSGGASTGALMRDLSEAFANPNVRSVLMVFDTPGGEVTGIHELAARIRSYREEGSKPIEAYVDGTCASAGYWLASATSRITTDATARLGSIGVVSTVRNPQAAGKGQDIDIVSSRSPKKRLDPTTESGRSTLQRHVDDLADVFISAVADNRGVSAETVENDFGEGFVLVGQKAVDAGLADALGSEEEVMERLARGEAPAIRREAAGLTATKGEGREANAEGVLARIRAVLGGAAVEAAVDDNTGPKANDERSAVRLEERDGATVLVADNGEELTLSADDRDRLASARDGELRTENARLADELADSREREKNLRARLEEAEGGLNESAVDRELDGFRADGVPPYLCDLARHALLAGGEEAGRFRTVLAAQKGTVETGERGVGGDADSTDAMTDDEKVRAEIEARGLDPVRDYARITTELVARGEIRQDAADEREE